MRFNTNGVFWLLPSVAAGLRPAENGLPRRRRQRRHSYQPRANAPGLTAKETTRSAESAIHRRDEAGRWPAINSNRTQTQGVALGWYDAGLWPEGVVRMSFP